MATRFKSWRTAVALSALALSMSPVFAVGAGASGSGSSSSVPVAQGVSPSTVPGAVPFDPTDPSAPEQVSFVLDVQNENQLANQVERGINNFVSVNQFAQQFGQSQQNIHSLVQYLNSFGISSNVYSDGLDVSTTGTAGQYDAALSVTQNNYHAPGHKGRNGSFNVLPQTFHGPTTSPQLPRNLASFVDAVLGLTNYSPYTTNSAHTSAAIPQADGPTGTACEAISGLPSACNTPTNFEQNYGLSSLESANAGHGSTIGIVTLAALNVGAPQYFWTNVLGMTPTSRTVSVQNIDGGPGLPSEAAGSTETDLDVEQAGGIAPGANVIVYQAPNTDSGFADAFFTAASQNVATDVSASWGESETIIAASVNAGVETSAYQSAFDEAFLEMAAQGQSGFVSAGDSGAYDASGDLGSTNLSVDSPGDSPFITSAGGTTLPWSASFGPGVNVTVTSQRAWGWDYLWSPIAALTGCSEEQVATGDGPASCFIGSVGGGGGYSTTESTPLYQLGVSGVNNFQAVQYLTPGGFVTFDGLVVPTTWTFNATPSVSRGHGGGRAEPDLSADADPYSGYLEYSPSFADSGGTLLQGGWGGTSFVAPQLNGSTAVIDSVLGHRVGLWNPSIYSFATSHNSPFTPLNAAGTSNDNNYFTGNPGTVYNPATGLGVPNLAAIARDFAQEGWNSWTSWSNW